MRLRDVFKKSVAAEVTEKLKIDCILGEKQRRGEKGGIYYVFQCLVFKNKGYILFWDNTNFKRPESCSSYKSHHHWKISYETLLIITGKAKCADGCEN